MQAFTHTHTHTHIHTHICPSLASACLSPLPPGLLPFTGYESDATVVFATTDKSLKHKVPLVLECGTLVCLLFFFCHACLHGMHVRAAFFFPFACHVNAPSHTHAHARTHKCMPPCPYHAPFDSASQGISAFMVPKPTEGLTLGKKEDKVSHHPAPPISSPLCLLSMFFSPPFTP